MTQRKLLSITRALLACPTAPFHEEAVAAKITALLAACPHVLVERDPFGNLIARYRRGKMRAQFAFAAHMDHPAYVGGEFLGGVPESYRAKNPPTRDFGAFAMWDLPPCEVRDGLIHSRACDDLIGCATIVAMFCELEMRGVEAAVDGLFTRAEEVGFIGALALAKSGLLPKTLAIISLETSAERPPAKIGDGPIIRVGDRTSIFDPALTADFTAIAAARKIPAQRCLMSGGTCEATAYQLPGYRCGALCVALGNYHNCGPEEKIAPEFVSLADVTGLVKLCTAIASADRPPDTARDLKKRLSENAAKYRFR